MTQKEFELWQAVTKNSQFRWTEDEIYRLNGRGAFYYHGGEDGIYMKIQKDGMLEAGNYEGAIPHIGEAFFKPVVERQCKDYNEAYTLAMEAGGKQFLIDMLSQPDIITPDEPEEKPFENYVYKPLYTVTVGDTDIEIAEDKNAAHGQRFAVYEREDLGLTEQFHRMVHTDDFAEAVKAFSDMVQDQVNAFQTTVQQTVAGLIKNDDPVRVNFYCPLEVFGCEPYADEAEQMDNSILRNHIDFIRFSLDQETHRGGCEDMAEYFDRNASLQEKLTSVRWDIEMVRGTVYGCIRAELTEPMTDTEKEDLRDWICGQSSDGFGEGFEQNPVTTCDGELYISFWNSSDDYFILDDDEFEQHLNGDQQMGGMQ